MKKNNLSFLFLISLWIMAGLGCHKEDITEDLETLIKYNEYFITRGKLVFKSNELELSYGEISDVFASEKLKTYGFKLYYFDISALEDQINTTITGQEPYWGIEVQINSLPVNIIQEGRYVISENSGSESFTFSKGNFALSEKIDTLSHFSGIYDITGGSLWIKSVSHYPYPGFESLIINTEFDLITEKGDTIRGEYIGRVLR